MKKHIGISLFFMECFLSLSATNYFVATNGDDSNAGTLDKPFATLQKAGNAESLFQLEGLYRPEIRYIFAEASIGYGKSR